MQRHGENKENVCVFEKCTAKPPNNMKTAGAAKNRGLFQIYFCFSCYHHSVSRLLFRSKLFFIHFLLLYWFWFCRQCCYHCRHCFGCYFCCCLMMMTMMMVASLLLEASFSKFKRQINHVESFAILSEPNVFITAHTHTYSLSFLPFSCLSLLSALCIQ